MSHATFQAVHHASAQAALANVYVQGGLLDQARDAIAKGVIGDFFKQLVATLGPIIGPIIIQLLLGLLHLPTPAAAAPATP